MFAGSRTDQSTHFGHGDQQVVSLLLLAVTLIMLAVLPDRATRLLQRVRDWLLRNARLIAAAIMVVLAAALLRDGISGLTHMS